VLYRVSHLVPVNRVACIAARDQHRQNTALAHQSKNASKNKGKKQARTLRMLRERHREEQIVAIAAPLQGSVAGTVRTAVPAWSNGSPMFRTPGTSHRSPRFESQPAARRAPLAPTESAPETEPSRVTFHLFSAIMHQYEGGSRVSDRGAPSGE
jgi:hypothetical protein